MSGLAPALVEFLHLLRRAGLPTAPDQTRLAAEALTLIDIGARAQVRDALRAVIVRQQDDIELFDLAFAAFWRRPDAAPTAPAATTPAAPRAPKPRERRLAEALGQTLAVGATPPERAGDAAGSATAAERLRRLDFEAMGAEELAAARRLMQRLTLPLAPRRTRRFAPTRARGQVDAARTIRASLATGGEPARLIRKVQITRPPPLVVLCDISGSMARYAQVLLHFLHGLAQGQSRLSLFLFGTRLTEVSRALRHRDAEVALARVAALVPDFSGGTRIGEAIAGFNKAWARRVLGQGATVILITDGLERDETATLAAAMAHLRQLARRIIWLNPLLRYDGFTPRAGGIRAILPHVDDLRPVHNLDSLEQLARALRAAPPPRRFRSAR